MYNTYFTILFNSWTTRILKPLKEKTLEHNTFSEWLLIVYLSWYVTEYFVKIIKKNYTTKTKTHKW